MFVSLFLRSPGLPGTTVVPVGVGRKRKPPAPPPGPPPPLSDSEDEQGKVLCANILSILPSISLTMILGDIIQYSRRSIPTPRVMYLRILTTDLSRHWVSILRFDIRVAFSQD